MASSVVEVLGCPVGKLVASIRRQHVLTVVFLVLVV